MKLMYSLLLIICMSPAIVIAAPTLTANISLANSALNTCRNTVKPLSRNLMLPCYMNHLNLQKNNANLSSSELNALTSNYTAYFNMQITNYLK